MGKKLKKRLVVIWNKGIDHLLLFIKYFYLSRDGIFKKILKKTKVVTIDETIDYIIANKCSVSRFGDGELKLINRKSIFFQDSSVELSDRLKEVLKSNKKNHIVCIPDIFDNLDVYEDEPYQHWKIHIAKNRIKWYSSLDKDKKYYNAFISRCYYAYKDKSKSENWFNNLKLIWNDRDIIIVEGRKSRLGIGNDLLDNSKSIKRILCPEKNAYMFYEEILEQLKKVSKSNLILLALGPTATILAYDLSKLGYQAVDIGHVDIEYEWFLRKSINKEKINNKFVGEAPGGAIVGECTDINYLSQILVDIQ